MTLLIEKDVHFVRWTFLVGEINKFLAVGLNSLLIPTA